MADAEVVSLDDVELQVARAYADSWWLGLIAGIVAIALGA